jgi:hypothetical protein
VADSLKCKEVGGLLAGAGGGFEVRELPLRGRGLGAGLLQLCEQGLELGFLLSKLLQCRLLLLLQLRLGIGASAANRRQLIVRASGSLSAEMGDVEPAGEVVGLLDEPERRFLSDFLTMGRLVAVDAQGVKLVLDDLGRHLAEGGTLNEIDEVRLGQRGKTEAVVDAADHALREGAELDERALRVGVGVGLGESAERCQIRPAVAQKREVQGFHGRQFHAPARATRAPLALDKHLADPSPRSYVLGEGFKNVEA